MYKKWVVNFIKATIKYGIANQIYVSVFLYRLFNKSVLLCLMIDKSKLGHILMSSEVRT